MGGGDIASNNEDKPEGAQRVLVVISSLGGGGAERVVTDLCEYLAKEGRHVTLLTLSGEDKDVYRLSNRVSRVRIEIRRTSNSIFQTLRNAVWHIQKIKLTIQSCQPDVVISFIDQTNVRVLLSLINTNIPAIVSERIHPAYHDIGKIWKIARRLTYPFAQALVVQTSDVRDWASKYYKQKCIYVIPNAFRSQRFGNMTRSKTSLLKPSLILAVGRLNRQKGFDLLIEAFRRSELAEQNWHLAILGEGPERDALESQINSASFNNAVSLPGFVQHIAEWYAKADMFILSSRYEGFPNALLEAMQYSLPCIAFDCPSGPSDIIDHGKNGLLVPPQNLEALKNALIQLAQSPELRSEFGKNGTEVNQSFSPETVYRKWSQIIDKVFTSYQSRQADGV